MASDATYWDPADCLIMLHMDGADGSTTFTDETGLWTWTASGNAQLDTAYKKFGTASGLFDGTGDHIYTTQPATLDFNLGTGSWTFDCWFKMSGAGNKNLIFDTQNGSDLQIGISDTTGVRVNLEGTINNFAWTDDTDEHHLAVVRSGNNLYVFIDGTQVGSTTDVTGKNIQIANGQQVAVGGEIGSTGDFDGWLDEVRLVKGTAIWTSNFTPPSAAYQQIGGGAVARRRVFVV